MPRDPNIARPVPPYDLNPVYHQQPVAPVHLSAVVKLQSGAMSGVSDNALKNPMGQDMEILEVKFMVAGNGNLSDNSAGTPFGGSIGCSLSMGSFKVTNGSVPVWLFGRAENLSAETKIGTPDSYCAYTWRLPRPLFVPAGAVLAPEFNHNGFVPSDLTVRVGYSARTVFKTPRVAYVPWVAAYMSKVFDPINVAGSDASEEEDLINDTDKVFHLQRFVGRTQFASATRVLSESKPDIFAARDLTMRMVDSYGRPIVRTYTPFRSVFGDLTRSWELEEVGAQLDPGAFYRVFLKKAAMTMAAGQNGGQAQVSVSMVGWREEPL